MKAVYNTANKCMKSWEWWQKEDVNMKATNAEFEKEPANPNTFRSPHVTLIVISAENTSTIHGSL